LISPGFSADDDNVFDPTVLFVDPRVTKLFEREDVFCHHLAAARAYVTKEPACSLDCSYRAIREILPKINPAAGNGLPGYPLPEYQLPGAPLLAHLPDKIRARIETVLSVASLAEGSGEPSADEARLVLSDVLDVLEWYVALYQSRCARPEPKVERVELLPQLRAKYPGEMHFDLTSVIFEQDRHRCLLETTRVRRRHFGSFESRWIERTDLRFILSDVIRGKEYFDPGRPVTYNAAKFVAELDEYSIAVCTDLFNEEAEARICEGHEVKGEDHE